MNSLQSHNYLLPLRFSTSTSGDFLAINAFIPPSEGEGAVDSGKIVLLVVDLENCRIVHKSTSVREIIKWKKNSSSLYFIDEHSDGSAIYLMDFPEMKITKTPFPFKGSNLLNRISPDDNIYSWVEIADTVPYERTGEYRASLYISNGGNPIKVAGNIGASTWIDSSTIIYYREKDGRIHFHDINRGVFKDIIFHRNQVISDLLVHDGEVFILHKNTSHFLFEKITRLDTTDYSMNKIICRHHPTHLISCHEDDLFYECVENETVKIISVNLNNSIEDTVMETNMPRSTAIAGDRSYFMKKTDEKYLVCKGEKNGQIRELIDITSVIL